MQTAQEDFPQGLKPLSVSALNVRAKARTLHSKPSYLTGSYIPWFTESRSYGRQRWNSPRAGISARAALSRVRRAVSALVFRLDGQHLLEPAHKPFFRS